MRSVRMGAAVVGALAYGVPATAVAERVVFLNTQPVVLNADNGQDPTLDSFSSAGFAAGRSSGWGQLTEVQRAELLFWLKEATTPFDITYTFERPAAGPYDMVVFGDETDESALFPASVGCSPAISLADCEDDEGDNISFMFWGCVPRAQQTDMRRAAFNVSTALGFGWGLEGLSVSGQVMGSYTVYALNFGNRCLPVAGTCEHDACEAGQQNSTADLLARIGARVDDGPPVLTVVTPTDLQTVGSDFRVEATVDDRFGGLEVNLEIVEAEVALDDPQPPYTWDLTGLTEGMWTLRVTALDADANAVVEEVVVCIGGDACPLPETTGGMDTTGAAASEDTGDATSTSGTAGGSGTTDDPSGGGINPTSPVPPGLGGSGPGSGCHCAAATDAPAPAAWLLGLLGLLGLTRPRGPYSRRMNVHSPSPVLRSSLIP